MELTTIIVGMIQTIIISLFIFYVERKQKMSDEKNKQKDEVRNQSQLLQMEMTMASSKLGYACAMALKRGHANGEVEEAVVAYNEAKDKYYAFISKEAVEHINES